MAIEGAGTDILGADLAAALRAGDPAARELFARSQRAAVRRWLWFRWRHTPFRALVDDGVQDVLVECLRPGGALQHLDPVRAARGLASFLRGVARNVALRIERSEAREFGRRQRLVATSRLTAPQTAEPVDDTWLAARIEEALTRLDAEDPARHTDRSLRAFLRLYVDDGLPVRAIARRWALPPEDVHAIRRRACRRLRDCLVHSVHETRADRADAAADDMDDAAVGSELLALLG